MKHTIYALCAYLLTSQVAQALTYGTQEGSFAREVATLTEMFVQEHEGSFPTSWAVLDPYLSGRGTVDEVFHYISPTKRYAFLARPLPLPPPHKGSDLLIITRRPFRDTRLYYGFFGISHGLREPGRYIIYRRSTGNIGYSYVEETYVQQAFRGSESLLPTPDAEPERPHERKAREARWRSIITWTLVALVAAAVLVRRFLRTNRTWARSMHTYESFPLYLRWPTNVDTPTNRKLYPKLAVITHEFTHRYPDGCPDPAYNETLENFDVTVTSAFDSPPRGVPILVETFGGKRHYYFCVSPDADLAATVQRVRRRYPGEQLSWECRTASGRDFLSGYAARSATGISPPVSFQQ